MLPQGKRPLGPGDYAEPESPVIPLTRQNTPAQPLLRHNQLLGIRSVRPNSVELTDPETSVGSSPLADVPWLSELPYSIRLKYLTDVNRWTRLEATVGLLGEVTGGELSRSLMWRELLHRYDVADAASLVFRDAFGCWGFLDLWRGDALGRFTAADAAYLAGLAAPLTTALREAQARTFAVPSVESRPWRGSVMLLLSGDLAVLGQTPETAEYLRVLVPPGEDGSPIPAGAYNVAAQLLAVEAGVDANRPSARVHLSGGRWLTLRASPDRGCGPFAAS